jgi:hypothetical protein
MNFWENLLRYPRFFISSMVGLFLVLVTPLLKLAKEIPNKAILFSFLVFGFGGLLLILNQMMNTDY